VSANPQNFRRFGTHRPLPIRPKLFFYFFTLLQANKLNGQIAAGFQAGEKHHVSRQFVDIHGLTHVQHKSFSALTQRSRAQNQMHGFRYGHEIPSGPRIGDLNRFALLDLFPEKLEHASTASGNVPEAYATERRAMSPRQFLNE
jgi:hypothetical protein